MYEFHATCGKDGPKDEQRGSKAAMKQAARDFIAAHPECVAWVALLKRRGNVLVLAYTDGRMDIDE